MKKAVILIASAVIGHALFLKVSEVVQSQSMWHSVADPLQ